MNEVTLDDIKFLKDPNTGYYLSSRNFNGKRIRLHRYVWIKHNGSIPDGYQVHHIDHNKDNNEISNLQLMTEHDHQVLEHKYHAKHNLEWMDKFHKAGIAAAPKWHASENGHEWHSKHYQEMKEIWLSKVNKKCIVCGKEYTTAHSTRKKSRFCSNKCKSKWRRDHHLDDVTRRCIICGKKFRVNKYSKKKTCSRKCAGIAASRTKLGKSKVS